MSDEIGGDEFEASLQARFGQETTEEPEAAEPEATEPEATVEPQEPIAPAEPAVVNTDAQLLEEHGLTQFKNVADALKSYRELQGLQGRQAQEIGEIRQQLQEFAAVQNRQPVQYDDLDPGEATQIAWERGDSTAARAALEQWKVDDPFAAAVWVGNVQRQAEISQLREEYAASFAPVQQRNQEQTIASAYHAVAGRLPDINQFGDAIMEAAQSAPEVVAALQSGTPADAERVFENLYWLAKGRQADTITAATQQSQAEQAEANRQAKAQAVVANVSSRPTSGEGKDAIDRFRQSILDVDTGLVDRFADA